MFLGYGGNFRMLSVQSLRLFYYGQAPVLWASPPTLVLILGIGGGLRSVQELRAQLSKAERDFGEELQGFLEFQGPYLPLF